MRRKKEIISLIYAQKEIISKKEILIYAKKEIISLIYGKERNHFLNLCKEEISLIYVHVSLIYAQKEKVSLIYAKKEIISLIYAKKEIISLGKERKFMQRKKCTFP